MTETLMAPRKIGAEEARQVASELRRAMKPSRRQPRGKSFKRACEDRNLDWRNVYDRIRHEDPTLLRRVMAARYEEGR